MAMIKKYKYDNLYYGGAYSYSETEAPVLKAKVFSVNEFTDYSLVDFCLDTGNDNRLVVPEHVLKNLGSYIDDTEIVAFDGQTRGKQIIYSIGLLIEELNFNDILEAVGTKNQFGLLPRTMINKWTILLDAPNKEFTINTND
jgi:hypothetical protein